MKVGVLATTLAILLIGGVPFVAMAGPATDSDSDGTFDVLDGCDMDSNAPSPNACDTDLDGYLNQCDGDHNNDGVVDALDFSGFFLPDFIATVDASGTGTDANCDGVVDALDFSGMFLPQFTQTFPGTSGKSCAYVCGNGGGVCSPACP